VKIFETLKHWTAAGRFAVPASLVAVIWGLLAFATPASAEVGETIDGAAAAVTPAAETPAAVVEGEGAQTAPVDPAPEPEVEVEEQEVPSAAEHADAVPVSGAVGSQDSTPAPESVDSPSPSRQVAAAGQEMSKLVRGVGKGSVEAAAPSTDRLPVVRISPRSSLNRAGDSLQRAAEPLLQVAALVQNQVSELVQKPLGSLGSAVGAMLPPIRPLLEAAAGPSADGPLGLSAPPQQPDSLSRRPAIGEPTLQRLPEPGGVEAIATGSRASESSDGPAMRPAGTGDANAILAATAIGRSRSQNPAPLDVPLPAPGSPGAIAPGSGSPIFVPLAALLALLALAAPAILRRLGEVPDFRPPAPFVCALERPG
jgi:hypothetical protein